MVGDGGHLSDLPKVLQGLWRRRRGWPERFVGPPQSLLEERVLHRRRVTQAKRHWPIHPNSAYSRIDQGISMIRSISSVTENDKYWLKYVENLTTISALAGSYPIKLASRFDSQNLAFHVSDRRYMSVLVECPDAAFRKKGQMSALCRFKYLNSKFWHVNRIPNFLPCKAANAFAGLRWFCPAVLLSSTQALFFFIADVSALQHCLIISQGSLLNLSIFRS